MVIVINGERSTWPEGTTIGQVVERAGLAAAAYAVEVNKQLVPRRRHAEQVLRDGDEVEIVTLVGGG
ncbi:MAG: sulfur carrier protein ThiS [Phycisphaeraceae bacterium]|nr:sulfur carrier protein ThiS [Phycisphaerae bacterium]MBX3393582.1 sulfur carrier protein ThiS [Phycisphaeraceae bacterium]